MKEIVQKSGRGFVIYYAKSGSSDEPAPVLNLSSFLNLGLDHRIV